jgi:hypothetical protein
MLNFGGYGSIINYSRISCLPLLLSKNVKLKITFSLALSPKRLILGLFNDAISARLTYVA